MVLLHYYINFQPSYYIIDIWNLWISVLLYAIFEQWLMILKIILFWEHSWKKCCTSRAPEQLVIAVFRRLNLYQSPFNQRTRTTKRYTDAGLLQGFDLMKLWELVKQSLEGFCVCIWCWSLKSKGQAVGREQWMWRGGEQEQAGTQPWAGAVKDGQKHTSVLVTPDLGGMYIL